MFYGSLKVKKKYYDLTKVSRILFKKKVNLVVLTIAKGHELFTIRHLSNFSEHCYANICSLKNGYLITCLCQLQFYLFVLYFNPFPKKPWFLRVCSISLLKTLWEKEKLLVTSNFSFSHSVFYLFKEHSAIFIKFEIVVCKLFQFGRV